MADGSVWPARILKPYGEGFRLSEPPSCTFDIANRLSAHQDGDGRSFQDGAPAIRAAFENKQLPNLESGAMAYMMSKSAYLTDEGDHNGPHVMFYTPNQGR
jgi:hypothetical protein